MFCKDFNNHFWKESPVCNSQSKLFPYNTLEYMICIYFIFVIWLVKKRETGLFYINIVISNNK